RAQRTENLSYLQGNRKELIDSVVNLQGRLEDRKGDHSNDDVGRLCSWVALHDGGDSEAHQATGAFCQRRANVVALIAGCSVTVQSTIVHLTGVRNEIASRIHSQQVDPSDWAFKTHVGRD